MNLSRGYSTVSPSISPNAAELSNFGPFFKNSDYAIYLKWKPFNYWKGRSVVFPFSYFNSIMWFLGVIPKVVREKIGDLQSMYCALPSYIGSFPVLSSFSTTFPGFKGSIEPKLLEVDKHLHRLKLPINVKMPSPKDIFNAKVTLETHPGVVTRKYAFSVARKRFSVLRRVKKKHVLHYAVHCVYQAWEAISEGAFRNTSGVYCVGSREKISIIEPDEILKTRPLFIPEITDILHGSTWLEYFKSHWSKEGLFKSEIWLGHSDTKMRYFRRLLPETKFKYSYDFDGKEWDSSVHPAIIVKAFNIFLSCFVRDIKITNHFRFIMETLVFKRIILHNGNTWFLSKGIPSGHSWTAFINSMVNWILWTSTIHNCPHLPQGVRKNYELQIQGDDVKIYSNEFISEGVLHNMLEWMLENFNYKGVMTECDPDINNGKTNDSKSSFLKRIVTEDGFLDTKTFDIFEKMLMGPEYSKLRNCRFTYLMRRLNDLAVFDSENRKRVAILISLSKLLIKYNERDFKQLFEVLFRATNGFSEGTALTWQLTLRITNISESELLKEAASVYAYIDRKYDDTYNTYKADAGYVDYWTERKESVTVTDALRNFQGFLAFPNHNIMYKMHSDARPSRFKRSRRLKCKYSKKNVTVR
jgi:hypothetical protein